MDNRVVIKPKYIFGLNCKCESPHLFCLSTNTVAYPVGNAIVLHDTEKNAQDFLHGVEGARGVTAFTISYDKTLAGVAQMGGDQDKPILAVFDTATLKRKMVLSRPEILASKYIALNFTVDSKHLVALSDTPEYKLYYWRWDKSKLLSEIRVTSLGYPMKYLRTSPVDNSVMAVMGQSTFRFFRYYDGHLKAFGYQRAESTCFNCATWLAKGDRIVAGTQDGRLVYFERGVYRHDIYVPPFENLRREIPNMEKKNDIAKPLKEILVEEIRHAQVSDLIGLHGGQIHNKAEIVLSDSVSSSSTYVGQEINAVCPYSKGFIISFGAGNVVVYEEQMNFDNPENHYKAIHLVRIPSVSSFDEERIIKSLAVSTSEEWIFATTKASQIFKFELANAIVMDLHDLVFEYVTCPFHHGTIVGMDVAARKSLIVTAGADRYIRIWDYSALTQEISKEFPEKILSVAFHPLGLYLLAGFQNRIRFLIVLLNDIKELKEIVIHSPQICRFSNGGHLFAVMDRSVIVVFSTIDCEAISHLKGHSNKVRCLKWSSDDTSLASVGADGVITHWEPISGLCISDYVERNSDMLDIAFTPDAKSYYAISRNKRIKEILIEHGVLLREFDLGIQPSCIAISRTGNTLVAGMTGGVVRSFRMPLAYSNDWTDLGIHSSDVTAIKITFEEGHCISASEDSSLIVWELSQSKGGIPKHEKEAAFSLDVLVDREQLEEREALLKELKDRYGEVRIGMEIQAKITETQYIEQIKNMTIEYSNCMTELRSETEELIRKMETNKVKYYGHLSQISHHSEEHIKTIEERYNTRLSTEFEKYSQLQDLLENTVREYENKMTELDSTRTKELDEVMAYYEGKLKEKTKALQKVLEETKNINQNNEEINRLIEEEGETDLTELMHSYESSLKSEKEQNAKLRAESNFMKKSFSALQQEIEEPKANAQKLRTEILKMKTSVTEREKDVTNLEKELADRDENLLAKEQIILELESANNELEKFKVVLDLKVQELKTMIEPKEREIIHLKKQNADIKGELDQTVVLRRGLELQIKELNNKIRVTNRELSTEKEFRKKMEHLLMSIRSRLHECLETLDDHRLLAEGIKRMYEKYGHRIKVMRAANAEQEKICDLVREKHHLEKNQLSVKVKLEKEADSKRKEQLKVLHENMLLVNEINNLRRELKVNRDQLESYETKFGPTSKNNTTNQSEKLKEKLLTVVAVHDELKHQQMKELEEKDNLIEVQQLELDSLTARILKIQDFVSDLGSDTNSKTLVDFVNDVLTEK